VGSGVTWRKGLFFFALCGSFLLVAVAFSLLGVGGGPAVAATATGNTSVTVSVAANTIAISVPSSVSFGSMAVGEVKEITNAGNITVLANSGYKVSASGTNFAANFPVSRLQVKVGTGNYVALSTTNVDLYTASSQPASPDGDTLSLSMKLSAPSSVSGSFSSTVTFSATNI